MLLLVSVSSRNTLQSQLSSNSIAQTSSSEELSLLRKKFEDAEREKRELLGVVSRLEEDITQRDTEIDSLREALKEARKGNQELEGTVRDIRASERATTVRFGRIFL